MSSYPTYEEWKQLTLKICFSYRSVLILPMRNGNLHQDLQFSHRQRVLILPMRNGNTPITSILNALSIVLILPMRNGNQILLRCLELKLFRSYPTYEEWKPPTNVLIAAPYYGSYPTYEEWKHPTFNKNKLTFPRSYPTYEEWKRIIR